MLGYADGTLVCTSACVLDAQGCGALLFLFEEGFEEVDDLAITDY